MSLWFIFVAVGKQSKTVCLPAGRQEGSGLSFLTNQPQFVAPIAFF